MIGWGLFGAAMGDVLLSWLPVDGIGPDVLFIGFVILVMLSAAPWMTSGVRSALTHGARPVAGVGALRFGAVVLSIGIGLGFARAGAVHDWVLPVGLAGVGLILLGRVLPPTRRST